ARGMSPREARLAAIRKLGNRTLVREEIYQMNTVALIESLWRDLRYALRSLRLSPGFAIVAILSLALGVGANAAIFRLLNTVRLRTLPVKDSQELVEVRIGETPNGRTGHFRSRNPQLTNPLWELIRERQQAFSSAFAWADVRFNLTSGGEARYAIGLLASGEFFNTLGVRPVIGRTLTPGDDRRGCSSPPAVLSYGFWQREYAGDPAVLGRPLMLSGHEYQVVGATPASFFGLEVGRTFDVIVPLCAEPLANGAESGLDQPDYWLLSVFGRLRDGWPRERATAHLASISQPMFSSTLPPKYGPDDAKDYLTFKLAAFPGGTGVSSLRRNYESPLWLLLATTGVVLLIACANLANLLLARATARDREIAVRLAIGASRSRIVRQLLAESALIAILGTAGGAVLAQWLSGFLVRFLTTSSNRLFVELSPDWRTFTFTAALGVATCLLFGLTPAIRATSTTPGAAIKAGSRGATDSRERFGLRRTLVVAQVALSMVLVVGALLFVRSWRNLVTLDAGFAEDGILLVNLNVQRAGVERSRLLPTFNDILARLSALPGVDSAALTYVVPISGTGWNDRIVIDGKKQKTFSDFNTVSAGYFATVGTPIIMGRGFDDRRDTAGSEKVAVVSETFARTFFAGPNPIGQVFQVEEGEPRPLYQIVGVAKDAKYEDLREQFPPIVFLPTSQSDSGAAAEGPPRFDTVVLRSRAPLTTITAEVTTAVAAMNPSIGLEFETMRNQVSQSLAREKLMATLSGLFGGLAALIAAIGLYGVMSYMVTRRRSEIGIRMALGADRREIIRMVMREAGLLVGSGIALGLVAAIVAARAAMTLLFGLTPGDPSTLIMAAAGFGVVALVASYLPAIRASRLQPTEALRQE
ncbi:MAG TPA: ABC transporter permease, partial [Vicinamibacterales bacterium]|nr:ABC transporter permease [Vicinamibacterales bacterium]